MNISRKQLRDIQKYSTTDFRKWVEVFAEEIHKISYSDGFREGQKASTGVDVDIVLRTALTDVKGYGPVIHERLMEHKEIQLNKIYGEE